MVLISSPNSGFIGIRMRLFMFNPLICVDAISISKAGIKELGQWDPLFGTVILEV